jgi:hypothetical protein
MKSCTFNCDIYRSDSYKEVLKKDIYFIDTPGLDCKELFLTIEKIDQAISQANLSIIGIAYVINLSDNREKPEEGKSMI